MRTTGLAVFIACMLMATASHAAERLVTGPYPGPPAWTQVTDQSNAAGAFLREQIPADQRIESYRDILTSQAFPHPGADTPSAFLQRIVAGAQGACEHVRVNGGQDRQEGGYTVAYAQIYCSRQKGQPFGVNMFFKVIKGEGAMYSVNRDFRVPPSAVAGVQSAPAGPAANAMLALMKAQAAADAYLVGQVYLCGPQATDARCKGK